jgi:diguanylate cyclase (GGDEF)-like protein/PAS domain S-box-containing protein
LRAINPGLALRLGFGAVLGLLLILTGVALVQLRDGQQRLDTMVGDHLAKITLANRMYVAARERTVALQRLLLVHDPFDRDELWMRFIGQANEFSQARTALLALALTDEERRILRHQGELTAMAVPIQNQVVELIWSGRATQAHRLLVDAAIPAQDRVLEQLVELYRLQEQDAAEAAHQFTRENERARRWLTAIAAAILVLALAVAALVMRQARRTSAALHEEKERAQVTLHSLGEAVVRTSAAGVIEYLNPTAVRLTGWDAQGACGRPVAEVMHLIHESTRESAENPAMRTLADGQTVGDCDDTVLIARSGEEHALELTAAPLRDVEGRITGAVLVFRDVTEVRALTREITYQATHDTMTGLVNRREFERQLQQTLDRVRQGGAGAALCFLDLDLFKAVNDTCGHLAGDELLRQVSLLLRKSVRGQDLLARIGGDEFAVLLHGCALDKAGEIAEQIRGTLRDFRFVWEDKRMAIGASLGVVQVAEDSGDLNDVLRTADFACRVAKEEGRNRVLVVRPGDLTATRRQHEINWLQRINQAISENHFVLYGQWIRPLGASRQKASHCEILLRLRDEAGQVILPAAFLPAAERYHLMPLIDRWVLHATLRAVRSLDAATLARLGCFTVNLSGQSVSDPEFLGFVMEELESDPAPAKHLCFEITETAAVTNLSSAVRLMERLRQAGCRFALDDFGSGASSFSYLKNLPVDFLKIDGAFVSNIPADATDLAMVTSINQVAHIMGIETIAEYVETAAIREALEGIGVGYGQGTVLARAVPLDDILRDLRGVDRDTPDRRRPG